jgi:hypothetical protein
MSDMLASAHLPGSSSHRRHRHPRGRLDGGWVLVSDLK